MTIQTFVSKVTQFNSNYSYQRLNNQILHIYPDSEITRTSCLQLAAWKKSYDQPRQHIKKQRHYLANKDQSSQRYGFSSSHVWM